MYEYWDEWPPVHESMRAAWLGESSSSPAKNGDEDGGDVLAFTAMPQVQGNWVGGPPLRPQDVIDLAERAKKKQHG